ncbi:MAG: hypothetical protein WC379_11960 [Methanoregula sp.]|jgi:hypothetical protein
MKRSPCHACIISAEGLDGVSGAATLRELIPVTFDVKIIYYVRRQDELIESWYNEIVKSSLSRYTGRLDDSLVGKYSLRLFDHDIIIRPWAESFGRENIIIRVYEKCRMNGDIIQDFSSVIGLVPDTGFVLPEERSNRSFSLDHLEFIRLCNSYFKDEPGIPAFLVREFMNSRLHRTEERRYLLAPSRRREILERYEESNQRIAREYLGRTDGRLFDDPWPDPDEPWEPYPGLTAAALVPIVTELIYNQGQRECAGQPLLTFMQIANNMLKMVPGLLPSDTPATTPQHPDRRNIPLSSKSGGTETDLLGLHSVDELVLVVAKRIYRRNLILNERRPLTAVYVIVNHLLARAVTRIPYWKRRRIGRRLAGGGQDNG